MLLCLPVCHMFPTIYGVLYRTAFIQIMQSLCIKTLVGISKRFAEATGYIVRLFRLECAPILFFSFCSACLSFAILRVSFTLSPLSLSLPTFFSSFILFSFFLLSHGQLINPFNSSSNLSHLPSPVEVVGLPSRFLLYLHFLGLTFPCVGTSNNLSLYVALLCFYIFLSLFPLSSSHIPLSLT